MRSPPLLPKTTAPRAVSMVNGRVPAAAAADPA
jgi:hypothetical protein